MPFDILHAFDKLRNPQLLLSELLYRTVQHNINNNNNNNNNNNAIKNKISFDLRHPDVLPVKKQEVK